MAFNWSCPYCNRAQSVVDSHFEASTDEIKFTNGSDGRIGIVTRSMLCANPVCRRTTVDLSVMPMQAYADGRGRYIEKDAKPLYSERVLPRGLAKPQPDYIPAALVQDYVEACLIQHLSPKSSATLARRCLQGMIRDFAKISRKQLIDEIRELRIAVENHSAPRAVTMESVDAIDHVRGVGNIGAHMEQDINYIIEIDDQEAGILIGLVELLFREWYVERHEREQRLASITALGQAKGQQVADARAAIKALPKP